MIVNDGVVIVVVVDVRVGFVGVNSVVVFVIAVVDVGGGGRAGFC